MSKRNFTLIIIILVIITVLAFVFFYLAKGPSDPGEDGGGTNFFSKFNPFGKNKTATDEEEPPVDVSGYESEETVLAPVKLKKVSSMPVSGFGTFSKERFKEIPAPTENVETTKTISKKITTPPTEFAPALRYMDRATGNIYQTFADKINERKFSSTIIPMVYETFFGISGEKAILRYLKLDDRTIASFAGSLPKEVLGADSTETNELKGIFLSDNIQDISLSPDLSKIFYLFESGESAIGITSLISGDSKVQVFSSPFTEWLSQWPIANMITLTTKPSAQAVGYMYAVDPAKKDFKKVFGGINGLTTLTSPNGKLVLYGDSSLLLSVYNINTKVSKNLGVQTLPEKCVWSKTSDDIYCAVPKYPSSGLYPDIWYKGKTSFSDDIWAINLTTGNTTLLVEPLTVVGGEDLDGIKLTLDKDENYLFLVNKKDSFLWELELK
jgi:hypothetical protein